MAKSYVTVVFDRKNRLKKVNKSAVELKIYLNRTNRKYITYTKCTASEWPTIQHSKELAAEVEKYNNIVSAMLEHSADMTIENFDSHAGITTKVLGSRAEREARIEAEEDLKEQNLLKSSTSFIDFIEQEYKKEDYAKSSCTRKIVVINSLKKFKRIKRFEDLTPKNLMKYDEWLDDGKRMRTTICNYHKHVHMYVTKAWKRGYIESDPYARCEIEKGKSKLRKPLLESELIKLRNLKLEGTEEKVRDLFIFAAYTGLAYCDTMLFNYKKMTEEYDGQVFIDGSRLKTGSEFYTPILPHAMEVLEKYKFRLPYFTNKCCNEHLREIRKKMNLRKPLSFHVARHSFATLCVNNDVPYEQLQKMLGHKDVKTTQIYAKVQVNSIARHTQALLSRIV